MKNRINYILMGLVFLFGVGFTACNEDDSNMSRAVLANVDVIEFPSDLAAPQEIAVTADADWVVEAPEWITITPSSGSAGRTQVEISVSDNLDADGTEGSPRSFKVIFKGRDLRSNYELLVKQGGDKFKNLPASTISEIENATDGETLSVADLIVTTVTTTGFMATDGTKYLYFKEPDVPVTVGAKVSVKGDKKSLSNGFPYMLAEKVSVGENATLPELTASNVKDVIGQSNTPVYVAYTAKLDGNTMKISDTKYSILLEDEPLGVNLSDINGHMVALEGYYMGVSSNEVYVVASKMEDKGAAEVVYFEDDFEWLRPWMEVGSGKPVGDQVGNYNPDDTCPQLQNCIVNDLSAYDAMLEKGYDFVFAGHPVAAPNGTAKECIYLQDGYIKFCKTSYHAGLVLPSLKNVNPGEDLIVSFNWTPMMQGSKKFDQTTLLIIVNNGDKETRFDVPSHTLVDKGDWLWMKADITLKGVTVDENTKITIRQTDDQFPDSPTASKGTTKRFFLDNIKVSQPL